MTIEQFAPAMSRDYHVVSVDSLLLLLPRTRCKNFRGRVVNELKPNLRKENKVSVLAESEVATIPPEAQALIDQQV